MCYFWYTPPCIPVWSPPIICVPPPVYVLPPPVYVPWVPPAWPVYPPVFVQPPPATKSYGFQSAEAPDALVDSASDAYGGDGFAIEAVGSAGYADYAIA